MATASEGALRRKVRSEDILHREGVRINQYLPVIENEEARLRPTQDVAYRTLALLAVALKGEGREQQSVEKLIERYGLTSYFTPEETVFIRSAAPSQRDRCQFSWRYEAASVLLWALGYLEELGKPSAICDVPKAVRMMRDRTTAQFLAGAQLRSVEQILDEVDLIYRYHWAVVDARINNKQCPAGLEPGVVQERHYALNWLIGYMNQDWDDVTTDT